MCSLTQKIGRIRALLGEAVIYVTKAFCTKHANNVNPTPEPGSPPQDGGVNAEADIQAAREQARDLQEQADEDSQKAAGQSAVALTLEARDAEFLIRFILTTECRRLVWNEFFGNDKKGT